jgi:quercetin dioxygenase-like cupin family protein
VKVLGIGQAAAEAIAASATRPATAVAHESPDARLVVFRLEAGQSIPPHRNASTVILTVIAGRGYASGGESEQQIANGDVVVFEPNELHGMRAPDEQLLLLATIAPRPGDRSNTAAV